MARHTFNMGTASLKDPLSIVKIKVMDVIRRV
jgi:hypothetical protein